MNRDDSVYERRSAAGDRTAAEAGWRLSRYLLKAGIPDSENVAVYKCPPYRSDPEAFVIAKRARMSS